MREHPETLPRAIQAALTAEQALSLDTPRSPAGQFPSACFNRGRGRMSPDDRERLCFACRKPGHMAKNCPGTPPKRWRPVRRGVRSLAGTTAAPEFCTPVRNRFSCLDQEEPGQDAEDVETDDGDVCTSTAVETCPVADVANDHEARISSLANDNTHELLCIKGKINGQEAVMLIDSGSTHDFIAASFVKRHGLGTETTSEMLHVTLADGSCTSCPLQQTDQLKVVISDTSERQPFTVFRLSRYDAILGMPWLTRNNPTINFSTNEVRLSCEPFLARTRPAATASKETQQSVEAMLISGRQARHALWSGARGYLAWVTVEGENTAPKPTVPPVLSDLLEEFSDVFPDDLPDSLPPTRAADHEIQLEAGSVPPSRPAYRLSKPEMDELQRQLSEMLKKGLIEPSKSPFGAPVFFVKKSDGSLRMVCDWRQLNRITIKNKACLPNVDDLLDTVQGSCYFTKLDLRSGYNQIRIKTEDVPKTAINTPFGHFQFRVMGFGLTNAPATFQSMMNAILQPYLRKCVVVFLDDILIFSKSLDNHVEDVCAVLQTLRDNQLYCKSSKCEFAVPEIVFLGHKIDGQRLSPDPAKLDAVRNWPAPTSVTEVRQFLGFSNYFRRFISHYSSMSAPLEEITGKNAHFTWNDSRQKAFESLRAALLSAPVLSLADVNRPFRVETDASDYALASVLLQQGSDQSWHPIAYASRKLNSAERNYTAGERETLAVVFALKSWRVYLFKHFDLVTDSMAVVFLRTKPHLTKREARWVEFLADFDFSVSHRPGTQNVADPLSRRPDLKEVAGCQINALQYALELNPSVARAISSGYSGDSELAPIIQKLKQVPSHNLHDKYFWDEQSGHLFLRDTPSFRLCVPKGKERLVLLQENHDCVTAGHPGRDRTYFRLARFFYWASNGAKCQMIRQVL